MKGVWEHFPTNNLQVCPICKTNEDKECVLIAIAGTEDGNICEAQPTHLDCVLKDLIYDKEHQLIYKTLGE